MNRNSYAKRFAMATYMTVPNKKWLAKVKTNRTLYADDDICGWSDVNDSNYDHRPPLRKNTTMYVYFEPNVDDRYSEELAYICKLGSGKICDISFESLRDVIECDYLDLLEVTEECRKEYMKEIYNE